MKVFIQKSRGSYVVALGKGMKLKCQIKTENSIEISIYIRPLKLC